MNDLQSRSLAKPLLPARSIVPIALMLGLNLAAFFGTRLLTAGADMHSMATALDAAIPFVPAMIIVYLLAYVQWGAGYLVLAHEPERICWYFAAAMIIAKLICAACFILYPTVMVGRPMPEGTDFISRLTAGVFRLDPHADNLFPSIHCLDSWFFLRVFFRSKQVSHPVRILAAVFTLAVFSSVVLVKQHVLADIPAGIACAETGLLLARLLFRDLPKSK